MTGLDTTWAIAELDGYLQATNTNAWAGTEVVERAQVVEKIIERVLPQGGALITGARRAHWVILREQAQRAKVMLRRADELRIHLGDDAPEMNAARLHPWAWENAAPYWRTGHFHQGVMQAALRLNAEAQAKAGRRDISETELFNQLFSLDAPKAGAPRLRLMNDDGSKNYQNVHRGARALAEGLYTAIRNPGSHQLIPEDDEQQSFEQLAAFSVLARWVDGAQLNTF